MKHMALVMYVSYLQTQQHVKGFIYNIPSLVQS